LIDYWSARLLYRLGIMLVLVILYIALYKLFEWWKDQ